MLTDRLADGLRNAGVQIAERHLRAPHILCLKFPHGIPEGLIDRLATERVYVAPRLGRIRISPHVYNDEADIDRFIDVFRKLAA
jgi:selenocysteine lyase/cysteine desulfurase